MRVNKWRLRKQTRRTALTCGSRGGARRVVGWSGEPGDEMPRTRIAERVLAAFVLESSGLLSERHVRARVYPCLVSAVSPLFSY